MVSIPDEKWYFYQVGFEIKKWYIPLSNEGVLVHYKGMSKYSLTVAAVLFAERTAVERHI